jgi:tryptophan synthase alpha chain
MSYLNPLLSFGFGRLATACVDAGVCGLIVPDLPLDESGDLRAALDRSGLALVQMVTPVTPPARLAKLCAASQGFIYAVTMTGTTGKSVDLPADLLDYLGRVRAVASVPVCAGFGIRARGQVERLRGSVDGVIVGSALVEVLERGESAQRWLATLRPQVR